MVSRRDRHRLGVGEPQVGQTVLVPWGLDEVEGRVEEVYGTPGQRVALVSVSVPGSEGEELGSLRVSFPVNALEPPGLLDLLAEMEETFPHINDTLVDIAQLTDQLGKQAERYTELINEADRKGTGARGRLGVLTRYANDLEPLAVRMDALAREYAAQIDRVEPGLRALLDAFEEDPQSGHDAAEFLTSLVRLGQISEDALLGVENFYRSLADIEDLSRVVRPKVKLLRDAILRVIAYTRRLVAAGQRAQRILAAA